MNIKTASSVVASLVLGSAALIISLKLNVSPTYGDFIVGNIAWYSGKKFQDLIVGPAFIFVSFFSYCFFARLLEILEKSYGDNVAYSLASQLVLWCLPFFMGVGGLLLSGVFDNWVIAISGLGVVFVGVGSWLRDKSQSEFDPNILGIVFLGILLISLIPIELAVLASKILIDHITDLKINGIINVGFLILGIGFVSGLVLSRKHNGIAGKNLSKIVLLAQIGLPIFYLTLYPARLLQPSGEVARYETNWYLKIFISGLVIFGLYDVVRRYCKYSRDSDLKKLFSPLAIFALITALKVGNTVTPQISTDDYHFGESLLGWWSYSNGAIPYVDYIPAHGMIDDDIRLFFSSIFFDGSASSVAEAGRLAFVVLGLIAFVSICSFSNSILLASLILILLGGRFAWLFLIPFISHWINFSLIVKPSKWLAVWIFTAPIVVLGVPPQGLLLVVAFSPLALKLLWDMVSDGNRRSLLYVGQITLVVLFIYAVTPLHSMLFGAIRYVIENGPVNQIAYGIPWSNSWNGSVKSGIVFETIRMSWVCLPILSLYIIRRNNYDFRNSDNVVYIAFSFLIFSLLLISYSMGRIDPGDVSRPGMASILSWSVFIPFMMWRYIGFDKRALFLLCIAFICSLLSFGGASFSNLNQVATLKVPTSILVDATKLGLNNIGVAHIDDSQLDRLTRLNTLLNLHLEPSESYLDLTSRNAHHFYVNRLPVLPITAPYNLVLPEAQKRAVNVLSDKAPKIALLQADNIAHDGGGLALRNPYLYRFVLDNYVPRYENGFIVGYKKFDISTGSENYISAEIKGLTDSNWDHGVNRSEPALILSDPVLVSMLKPGDVVHFKNGDSRIIKNVSKELNVIWLSGNYFMPNQLGASTFIDLSVTPQVVREYYNSLFQRSFSVSDYQKIPIAWGLAAKKLENKLILVEDFKSRLFAASGIVIENNFYKIVGPDPYIIFDLSNASISGSDASVLKFDFECIGRNIDPKFQIFWWGDDRDEPYESSSIKFTATDGTLIVPVDASPSWATSRKIKGLRIDIDNPNACQSFRLYNMSLFKRAS